MAAGLISFALAWIAYAVADPGWHPKIDALHRLSLPFVVGVVFFVLRHRLPLTLWGVAGLWGLAALLPGTWVGLPVLGVALGYTVFWLAYVPRGPLLSYNRLGDYSYGIYIYAFPIQGLVAWLFGPTTPLVNIALSLPVTVFCAILSWHLVEAPSLALLRKKVTAPA
jgi:peptidoglycan/LPS O-acetylase OafA/YrhL